MELVYLLLAMGIALPGDTVVYRGAEGELRVEPPRAESPAVRVDGRLDEAVWREAAVLTGFTQSDPVEGIPASQETEVRV
ncbi:MAG: hypothetical protein R6U63_16400, partial [Longimicrobiales bacterium]